MRRKRAAAGIGLGIVALGLFIMALGADLQARSPEARMLAGVKRCNAVYTEVLDQNQCAIRVMDAVKEVEVADAAGLRGPQ
jgi:hypothetical protein